jgi:hypothetical protein
VVAARKVAELLPSIQNALKKEDALAPVMDIPFDEVWQVPEKKALLIDDGAEITVDWASPDEKKFFLFNLTLPGQPDCVFQIAKSGWYYDMESEGQCQAYIAAPGTSSADRYKQKEVWLHWDAKQKAIAVSEHRNWVEGRDGSLTKKGIKIPPLSFSLLIVLISSLAQDIDAGYTAPSLLRKFIKKGQIDETIICKATQFLLRYLIVSPAKLVRVLERNRDLLPVLWPMLTECVKKAGALAATGANPPVWANRVLDVILRYAPYLAEAAKRGFIPARDAQWTGLSEIASSKAKSTAIAKANKLLTLLG